MSIQSDRSASNPDVHVPTHSTLGGPCAHEPRCPSADVSDRDAAHIVANHPEQGWNLLCNGVVLFEDTGEILPDGHCISARRADLTAAALHRLAS